MTFENVYHLALAAGWVAMACTGVFVGRAVVRTINAEDARRAAEHEREEQRFRRGYE
jgi:hypothetical protein